MRHFTGSVIAIYQAGKHPAAVAVCHAARVHTVSRTAVHGVLAATNQCSLRVSKSHKCALRPCAGHCCEADGRRGARRRVSWRLPGGHSGEGCILLNFNDTEIDRWENESSGIIRQAAAVL